MSPINLYKNRRCSRQKAQHPRCAENHSVYSRRICLQNRQTFERTQGNDIQRDAKGQNEVELKHTCSTGEIDRLKIKWRIVGGQGNKKE